MHQKPFLLSGYFLLLVSFVLSECLFSCKQNDVKIPFHANYFPLKIHQFYIYNVDSVRYHNVPFSVKKPDSAHFQLKDSVISTYKDVTGTQVFIFDEYKRNTPADKWTFLKTITRSSTVLEGQETDGNIRYVKLVYPVVKDKSWNANKYNTLDSTHAFSSSYISVDQPWGVSGLSFDSTAFVQLQKDSSLINKYVNYERYAARVGLVYKQHDSVFIHTSGGNDTTYEGYKRKQVLLNYGPK